MAGDKLKFRCKHFQKMLAVSIEHAGKQLACPGCKNRLQIPVAGAMSPGMLQRAVKISQAEEGKCEVGAFAGGRALSCHCREGTPAIRIGIVDCDPLPGVFGSFLERPG